MDRTDITADLATRLVATQFPQWADATVRLGDELSVRYGDELMQECMANVAGDIDAGAVADAGKAALNRPHEVIDRILTEQP